MQKKCTQTKTNLQIEENIESGLLSEKYDFYGALRHFFFPLENVYVHLIK